MMKLRYSPTSPYVRKVTVLALECGLDARIERVPTPIQEPAADFLDDNPLGKVPALVTDDGVVLYDSPVIAEYLDSLHAAPKLFPSGGPARWQALRIAALADGIVDAGVLRRMESLRPAGERSPAFDERQRGKVFRGLDAVERDVPRLGEPISIAHIAVGCALGWLEFRFPDEDWRIRHPLLTDWYAAFAARPSMMATVPRD